MTGARAGPDRPGARAEAVLIAAQSGRALAAAARRAGLKPLVLDLFGDADTRDLAEAWAPLPGRFGGGIGDRGAVLAALDGLAASVSGRSLGVVLGSGFEAVPDLIAGIAARHRLLGAGADDVTALKDPARLAALCAHADAPHPPVTSGPVPDPENWLVKRIGGSGGGHVRPAASATAPPGHYLQARVPGRAFALNVLAHRDGLDVLGLTEQWSASDPKRPYRFAGAVLPAPGEPSAIPASLRAAIVAAVSRLLAQTGLRGLASADLLIDGGRWWLLEVNPRPGATLDVLDRRSTPFLAAHMEACLGGRPEIGADAVEAAGTEICYATRRLPRVPPLDWPDHVRDRPCAGTTVGRGSPLCTVTAEGPAAGRVREVLRERAAAIGALLAGGENRHGHRQHARQRLAERQRADGAPRGTARG